MNLLRSLGNVLRGRNRHWNRHNTEHWRELWGRAELLPVPTAGILQSLLLGSWLFVDGLLGPKRTLDLGIDCLALRRAQFERLHAGVLEYSAELLVGSNPLLRESVLGALPLFTGADPGALATANVFPSDPSTIGRLALERLQERVHAALELQDIDPLVVHNVAVLASSSSSAALKGAQQVLQAWSAEDPSAA